MAVAILTSRAAERHWSWIEEGFTELEVGSVPSPGTTTEKKDPEGEPAIEGGPSRIMASGRARDVDLWSRF